MERKIHGSQIPGLSNPKFARTEPRINQSAITNWPQNDVHHRAIRGCEIETETRNRVLRIPFKDLFAVSFINFGSIARDRLFTR